MFQDAFTKLEPQEAESLLDKINPRLEGTCFKKGATVIMAQAVSFYPGYRYLDISNHDVSPPSRRYVLYKNDDIVVLNWDNETIYDLNRRTKLCLNEKNIMNYVRFFFSQVRGQKERFVLIENTDDIPWQEEPAAMIKKEIGDRVQPLEIIKGDSESGFLIEERFLFKDSLLKCDVTVSKDGVVSLSGEALLIEEMPVRNDVLMA